MWLFCYHQALKGQYHICYVFTFPTLLEESVSFFCFFLKIIHLIKALKKVIKLMECKNSCDTGISSFCLTLWRWCPLKHHKCSNKPATFSCRIMTFGAHQTLKAQISQISFWWTLQDTRKKRYRSSPPEMLSRKVVLKICSKFTGEHPYQCVISINLFYNFIEIALQRECYPVKLRYIFRTLFPKNTSGWLLLIKAAFTTVRLREGPLRKG